MLVLGGGAEAKDKVERLILRGARVTLVWPEATAQLATLAKRGRITWFVREFQPTDVQGAHLVFLTEQNEALARQLAALRVGSRFWLCALDQPTFSDVYLVSTVMRGPVQIGISTGGFAPSLARTLRKALEKGLDSRFSRFARSIARLRTELRSLSKDERKERLEHALNGFAMELRVSYPPEESQGLHGDGDERAS